jgi:hypothetical protein
MAGRLSAFLITGHAAWPSAARPGGGKHAGALFAVGYGAAVVVVD